MKEKNRQNIKLSGDIMLLVLLSALKQHDSMTPEVYTS